MIHTVWFRGSACTGHAGAESDKLRRYEFLDEIGGGLFSDRCKANVTLVRKFQRFLETAFGKRLKFQPAFITPLRRNVSAAPILVA